MDPITIGLLAGAGTGLLKNYLVDAPAEQRNRKLQAATARWSPWTNMKPTAVKEANPFGNALQFGVAGGGMGGNIMQAQQNKALSEALTDYYNRGGEAGVANLASQGAQTPSSSSGWMGGESSYNPNTPVMGQNAILPGYSRWNR